MDGLAVFCVDECDDAEDLGAWFGGGVDSDELCLLYVSNNIK